MKRRQYGTGSLVQHGRTWYMRFYDGGKRVEESARTTDRKEAERKLKVKVGELAAVNRVRLGAPATVADALRLVEADYREKRAASLDDTQARIRLHLTPALGATMLADLKTPAIKAYIASRKRQEAAVATINRELSVLRRALKLAMQQEPPWIGWAPTVRALREDNTRVGFVTHEQYGALRNALPVALQLPLVIGYHTGLRRSTILSIRINQVDLAAGVIRIEAQQTKTRKAQLVPIYGDMRGYIELAMAANRRYLCEIGRQPIGSFRKTWITATKAAEVPGLLFHDLRRSAVRNMIQAGVPETVAMQISGHRTQSMLHRYNIIAERDIVAAAAKIQHHLESSVSRKLGEKLGEVSNTSPQTAVQ